MRPRRFAITGQTVVRGGDVSQRVLDLAIQHGAGTPQQMQAIRQAAEYAKKHEVKSDTHQMKFAVLYQCRGKLIVGAQARTTAGVLIAVEEPVSIDAATDVSALGKTLRDTLERSKSPVPHPHSGDWPALTDQFLRATGVKTSSTFVKQILEFGRAMADQYGRQRNF